MFVLVRVYESNETVVVSFVWYCILKRLCCVCVGQGV